MKSIHQFSVEQESYLTSDATLEQWASKSMVERVALFKSRYPRDHCTVYKLRKLYKARMIRMKKIRKTKIPDANQQWRITF